MRPLTPRQQQIFDLIREKISDTGMPPTRAEIATYFGFKSANAAEEHLKASYRASSCRRTYSSSRTCRAAL